MKLWEFFEKNGRDLKARIYAEGKQVACFTLGKMRPDLTELAEAHVLAEKGPDKDGYIDIYVDGKVRTVIG